jgi:glycosyltransferase involved in cell wall biosynthesis
MRVAILGQFPTDLSRLGGVEVAIVYLMDTLRSAGVDDLHIISCRTELQRPQSTTVRGATVHYLPRQNQGRLTWHLRETRRMQALLREIKPDLVHGHSTGLYAGAALGSGFPNVVTAHGIVAREVATYQGTGMRLRGSIDALYERRCLARAKDIIAISPYVQRVFQPLTHARFHLIENAVDYAFFQLAPLPEPGRILFAGAVIERKGLVPLVRALALLKQKQPNFELRIAGGTTADPQYYQTLLRLAESLGVASNIAFLGQLDQDHLLDEYARAAIFVLPSFQETAPMAAQQALAAALPVVATPAGGVPDLVRDGETGLLVSSGDSDALAAAILRLLQDDGLRSRMAALGRQDAQARFVPDVVARKTLAVYKEILARSSP